MCSKCDWESVIDECEDMLLDFDYDFAEDTIIGIKEWIEENEHVTDKQRQTIDNIKESI